MTAAKIMDIISRLPGCDGQSSKTQYRLMPWEKMEDAHKIIENSQIGMSRHLDSCYHDTNGPNHGPVWKTQSLLLSEIFMVIFWQDCYGKDNLRKSYWNTDGRRFPIGNAFSYTRQKRLFLSVHEDDIKLAGKEQNIDPMLKVLNKEVDLGRTQHLSFDHVLLGLHSKTMCQ